MAAGKEALARRIGTELNRMEEQRRPIRNSMAAGVGISAAFDPRIGIPVAVPGIIMALKNAVLARSLERKLARRPKAARMLAKRFLGTKHESYFREIAARAESFERRRKAKKVMAKIIGLKRGKDIRRGR